MKRAKVTCTFTLIEDLDPDNFDPGELGTKPSLDKMLEDTKTSFEEDPELILEMDWDDYSVTVEEVK